MKQIFNEIRSCNKCKTNKRCLPGWYVDDPKVLFVTQNPGSPHKYPDFDDNILYTDLIEEEFLKNERIALEKCAFGHFIKFLLQTSDYTLDDISRFNVVKMPGFFNSDELNWCAKNCLPFLQRQLWHQTTRKVRVISIGRIAQRALAELEIDSLYLPHPSYLRRWKGTFEIAEYREKFERYINVFQ